MKLPRIIHLLFFFLSGSSASAQYLSQNAQATLEKMQQLQFQNKSEEALATLHEAIETTDSPDDLTYFYAHQSGIYASMDSLFAAKQALDLSLQNAEKTNKKTSKAVAYRAKAYLNNLLNLPDEVVKDALTGLKYVANNDEDPVTKYYLYYLLYGVYSKWSDDEKMDQYIRMCQKYALLADNFNLQANVDNGLSSMYIARYTKTKQTGLLDSIHHYLQDAFALHQKQPEKVSSTTFVIICINLANYYLELSPGDIALRKEKAYEYLDLAEEKLNNNAVAANMWINVLGIKSGFAKIEGNWVLAEQYLLQGLSQLALDPKKHFQLEYRVNKELAEIALRKNDQQAAIAYLHKADESLTKSFNEQQLLNAQKLEIQYETEKKDQQLSLLNERAEYRKRQNYLYAGIAAALLFGLVFMFSSYRFKLRYSRERAKKLQQEQARLKAEQELLELKRQQLEKEALTNSLIIEQKNETLKQIQDQIQKEASPNIQKLLKEERLLHADFEDIKMQMQQLHPDFFNRLSERAQQKLTALDLRYCAYMHLKMTTKQIAQVLHVAPQSVRMFKYRLKQKFGLDKESDLEEFLQKITRPPASSY